MRAYMPVAPGARFGYSHTRPVFVVDDLDELHGPTTGTVAPPLHIDWTPSSPYDMSNSRQVRSMYATVLREAMSEVELATWISRDLLFEHWVALNLPVFTRETWESVHPSLRQQH